MPYLRNVWYQAGWSADVPAGGHLARTIVEEPMVFFRKADGALAAIGGRCPHRFAPLARGVVADDLMHCGYHGLAFDSAGQCVLNPHGMTPRLRVPSYAVAEKHRAIWVWIGDQEKADPALIRDLPFIDECPEAAWIKGYMPTRCNYELLTDNILDLSHTNSLHRDSIGTLGRGIKMAIQEDDQHVVVRWTDENIEPQPIFKASAPDIKAVDFWVQVSWAAPAVMILDSGLSPAGKPPRWEDWTFTLHSMTPETATTTHYFFAYTRRNELDNPAATEATAALLHKAFSGEDKPMLEAQQQMIGEADIMDLKPANLAIDGAGMRARRKLAKMIAAQSADSRNRDPSDVRLFAEASS